uniref:Uncharacterized protein n=1 Tax=Anguilla anguilla TaxID=7936 RepID=A0A0E9TL69_ANGAN
MPLSDWTIGRVGGLKLRPLCGAVLRGGGGSVPEDCLPQSSGQ